MAYKDSARMKRAATTAVSCAVAAALGLWGGFALARVRAPRPSVLSSHEERAWALVRGRVNSEGLLAVPDHLAALIDAGPEASPALLPLLYCERATPITFIGKYITSFTGQSALDPTEHQATVADLADYALRHIHTTNARWRAGQSDEERERAVLEWRRIVAASRAGRAGSGAPKLPTSLPR